MAREIEPGSLDEVLQKYRDAIRGKGDPNDPLFQEVQKARQEGGVLDMIEEIPELGISTPEEWAAVRAQYAKHEAG